MGDVNISTKIGLSVVEAGWLLQRPEGQIRGMLRRGELAYVVAGRKIDPASVREHLDGAYARLLLDVVLGGEFEVPRPVCRGGSLHLCTRELWVSPSRLASPCLGRRSSR